MVVKMTLKNIRESEDMRYNTFRFGNPKMTSGNICYFIITDRKGTHEIPVKIKEEKS